MTTFISEISRRGLALLCLCVLFAGSLAPQAAQGQNRYAVFISGYGENVWTTSGTPQDWKARGVIRDYVILDGTVVDLLNAAATSNTRIDAKAKSFLGNTSTELNQKLRTLHSKASGLSNVEIVFVGHSVGGYVARALGSALEQSGLLISGIGLWAPRSTVVTLATPHQGLRIGNQSGAEIKAIIDPVLNTIEAPLGDIPGGFDLILNPVVLGLTSLFPTTGTILSRLAVVGLGEYAQGVAQDKISPIRGMLAVAQKEAGLYLGAYDVVNSVVPFRKQVVPGSYLIRELNRLPNPENYLSVYSAEKSRTVFRLLGGLPDNLKRPAGLEGESEADTYQTFLDIRRGYRTARDMWNALHYSSPFISQIRGYRKKANRWKEGERRINDLDNTWAQIIDSFYREKRTGYRTTCTAPGGEYPQPIFYLETEKLIPIDDGGSSCTTTSYTYYVTVKTKSDGVFGPNYGVWKTADQGNPFRNVVSAARNGDAYFGDTGTSDGYNHFEIRRSKRGYNGPGFSRGNINPPIRGSQGVEQWLRRVGGVPDA